MAADLQPLDVEAVARWFSEQVDGVHFEEAGRFAQREWRRRAAAFCATFGRPAPDAEALRLARWLDDERRHLWDGVDCDDYAPNFRAIAARLRGEST